MEHSTGMQETAGEMNYIASLFVHQFYEWAKGKNVEPHHIMAVVDWGPFTTVAKTVWTSEKQMALMLFNAKKYLDSEAERIGGFKIPKELES